MIGEFMFGFGAGGDISEFKHTEAKKNNSENPESRKTVTLTKEEFMRKGSHVIHSGDFARSCNKDPVVGAITMMNGMIFLSELTRALFDEKEDQEDGRKETSGKSSRNSCRDGYECSE